LTEIEDTEAEIKTLENAITNASGQTVAVIEPARPPYTQNPPIIRSEGMPKWILPVIILESLVILGLVAYIWWRPGGTPFTPSSYPQATIRSPSNGTEVGETFNAAGTVQNVPEERELWLYHYDMAAHHYYFDQLLASNGAWHFDNIVIGETGVPEGRNKYRLGLISVNKDDGDLLRQQHDTVQYLPNSALTLTEIFIIRK